MFNSSSMQVLWHRFGYQLAFSANSAMSTLSSDSKKRPASSCGAALYDDQPESISREVVSWSAGLRYERTSAEVENCVTCD
uniref:Ovule protein n=1 Tax=Parascaris univalens TaxID=6257 RepID=A0A915A3H3_PARUN